MRCFVSILFVSAIALGGSWPLGAGQQATPATLPDRLSDGEFWQAVTDASEPGGTFRSRDITNFTSNEMRFQQVIPELVTRTRPGGVYLGVGPEQNFTYIAVVRPRLAVIVDIRRGNLATQLMYKAIFELTRDRASFVSMLFSKPVPGALSADVTAAALFSAFAERGASEALFQDNLGAILTHLTRTHAFPLDERDRGAIEAIYRTFYESGFAVRWSPTYQDLMTATDSAGVERSYLATESAFRYVKDLQSRNLVIPVVGDFAGPKALRWVGGYARGHGAIISAFYLSNVEQYLVPDGRWAAFCANVASLPLDPTSTFIRSWSDRGGSSRGFGGFVSGLGEMKEETRPCSGS